MSRKKSTEILQTVHIFSDSQEAIGILKLGWQPTQHKQTVAEIRHKIQRLEHHNTTVNISWTPGHSNIRGNEEADRLAKEHHGSEAASSIHKTTGFSRFYCDVYIENPEVSSQMGNWQYQSINRSILDDKQVDL